MTFDESIYRYGDTPRCFNLDDRPKTLQACRRLYERLHDSVATDLAGIVIFASHSDNTALAFLSCRGTVKAMTND
jgi:hypothetical protein